MQSPTRTGSSGEPGGEPAGTPAQPSPEAPERSHDPLSLTVTLGLLAVAAGWVVTVALLMISYTPGTNAIELRAAEGGASVDATAPADASTAEGAALDEADAGDGTGTAPEVAEGDAAGQAASGVVSAGGNDDAAEPAGAQNVVAAPVAASLVHRIVPGDTLIGIGANYGVDWRQIASINNISDPNVIAAGRILQIPNPEAVALVTLASVDDALATELDAVFDSWAAQTDVPLELLKAVAWHESRWDPQLVGLQGEIGIGQLLPEIHAFVENDLSKRPLDAASPADSVEAMARYLGWLLAETQGDTSATLASYHQGLTSQRNIGWNGETIQYISEVIAIRPEFVARTAG